MTAVRLLVTDTGKALEFYVGVLGFELVQQWGPAFAIVENEALTVWLSGPQTSAAQPLADGTVPVPGGFNRIVLQVEDLDEALEQFRVKGVVIRNGPISGPGGSQALVEDGVGNLVEIFEERE